MVLNCGVFFNEPKMIVGGVKSFKDIKLLTLVDMLPWLSSATYVANVLKELNYNYTFYVERYKEIFSLFSSSFTIFDIIQIVGTVAHTYKGLKYLQGTHEKKITTLCTCETTFLCVVDNLGCGCSSSSHHSTSVWFWLMKHFALVFIFRSVQRENMKPIMSFLFVWLSIVIDFFLWYWIMF